MFFDDDDDDGRLGIENRLLKQTVILLSQVHKVSLDVADEILSATHRAILLTNSHMG